MHECRKFIGTWLKMSSDRKIDNCAPPDKKDELWTENNSRDLTDSLFSSMDCINMDALNPLSSSEKDQLIVQLRQKCLNLQLELYILRENRKMSSDELNSPNLLRKYKDVQENYSQLQKAFVDMRDTLAKANSTIEIYEKQLKVYEVENNALKESLKDQESMNENSEMSSLSGDLMVRLEETKMKYVHTKTQSDYYQNLYETTKKLYECSKNEIEQLKEELSNKHVLKDDIENLKLENEELNAKLQEAIRLNDTDGISVNAMNVIQTMGKEQKGLYALVAKLKRKYEELIDKCKNLELENFNLKQKSKDTKDVITQTSVDEEWSPNSRTKYKKDVNNANDCSENKISFQDGRSELVDYYEKLLTEKDVSIEHLNEELKKRTYNLQELVNKELWNKNREIEKLNKLCEKRKCELILLQTQIDNNRRISSMQQLSSKTEIPQLKKPKVVVVGCASNNNNNNNNDHNNNDEDKENFPLSNNNNNNHHHHNDEDKENLLKEELRDCLHERNILLKRIEDLEKVSSDKTTSIVYNETEDNECSLIRNLRLECSKRKKDVEAIEKSRQEAYNACHLLTTRLEELADFLETLLLTGGDFLTISGNNANVQKREILKQAIERSREISKCFSISFLNSSNGNCTGGSNNPIDLSVPILPDCSEINLSFSGGDNDDDDDVNNNNNNDNDITLKPVAESDDFICRNIDKKCLNSHRQLFNDDVSSVANKRSLSSTSVLFVNHFDPNDELIFSSNGGRPLLTTVIDSGRSSSVDGLQTVSSLPHYDPIVNDKEDANDDSLPDVSSLMTDDDRNTIDSLPQTQDEYEKDTIDSLPDVDSYPDDMATIGSAFDDDRRTIDSTLDGRNTASDYERHRYRAVKYASRLTTSSALVSVEDRPSNRVNESESEQWSEPDRNVSAERIGLQDTASLKLHKRAVIVKQSSPPRRDADNEVSAIHNQRGNKCEETRVCPKFSDEKTSCKRECNHHQLILQQHYGQSNYLLPVVDCADATNCATYNNFDAGKYDVLIKTLRRLLQNTIKHLYRSNKVEHDRLLMDRLRKISEQFETLVGFCSKVHHHFRTSTSRCELLTNILDKTQSQFEQVMTDLRSLKLSYNNVILERERNSTLLQRAEVDRDDLKSKLNCEEEKYNRLEKDYADSLSNLTKELEAYKKKDFDNNCRCKILRDELKQARDEMDRLKASLPSAQAVLTELTECKRRLEQLLIEKRESEKRELEYRRDCSKLEEELRLKDELNNRLLSSEREKYEQSREIVERLKREISDLNALIENDRIITSEKERLIVELKQANDDVGKELTVRNNLLREREIKIDEYETELTLTKAELTALSRKTEQLQSILSSESEAEQSRRRVEQLEKQTKELQNIKTQHEKKMKELLRHIIEYRHEEEKNVEIHKRLLRQIERLKSQKIKWKNETTQWKRSYDTIEKRTRRLEDELRILRERAYLNCVFCADSTASQRYTFEEEINDNNVDDNDSDSNNNNNNNNNLIASSSPSSSSTSSSLSSATGERHSKALHQDKTLSKLEKRVQELETVNKELESRLDQLHVDKVSLSDCEMTSGEESPIPSTPSDQTKSLPSPSAILDSPTYNSYVALSSLNSPARKSTSSLCCDQLKNDIINQWIIPADDRNKLRRRSDDERDSLLDTISELKHSKNNTVDDLKTSRTNSAISPDLGIDSDHGRPFSFDECAPNVGSSHDELVKLEEENNTLKQQLDNTRTALQETLQKLTSLNRNKKQMEKAICKQLYKTSSILKKARVNLEEEEEEVQDKKTNVWTTSC